MFVIEPNRPDHHFTSMVPGAGPMPDLSRAAKEAGYDREYSLVYMDAESPLHRLVQAVPDPRELEWRMHRDYDSSQARADTFMLNGRSFPFTLRDTPVRVAPDEKVRLRVLNSGERTLSLHTHGHHPVVTALDGVDLAPEQRYSRDVFTIGPGQRIDLELRTTADDRYASGPGVWAMHDHTELTVTNRGLNPGGDLTAIIYDDHWDETTGLPKVAGSLERLDRARAVLADHLGDLAGIGEGLAIGYDVADQAQVECLPGAQVLAGQEDLGGQRVGDLAAQPHG